MDEENKSIESQDQASASALPEFCPNDGTVMEEGTKFGFNAWICPDCGYWKLKP